MRPEFETPIETLIISDEMTLELDWYVIKKLDDDTFAIGEPADHQRNWSYLLNDGDESLIFDTGSGRRSISRLLEKYSRKRLVALPSHLHFDHLGGVREISSIIMADLPALRSIADGDIINPPQEMFLGDWEGIPSPIFKVSEWIRPEEDLRIGNRVLKPVGTPGHSLDSISLWEEARNRFFSADFIYPGSLYAQTPGACLRTYAKTVQELLKRLPSNIRIYGAHGQCENQTVSVPELDYRDLIDLNEYFLNSSSMAGASGRASRVNERINLIA